MQVYVKHSLQAPKTGVTSRAVDETLGVFGPGSGILNRCFLIQFLQSSGLAEHVPYVAWRPREISTTSFQEVYSPRSLVVLMLLIPGNLDQGRGAGSY